MSALHDMTLAEAAAALRARRVSAVELLQAQLARARAVQPAINAFIRIDEEPAMAQARALDSEAARGHFRGPLHGVPMAHKDMFYRTGLVTTCGSAIRRNVHADTTATALERLDAAGAIDFGTLNMAEFAYGPTGHNVHVGAARNPWNTAHITGGCPCDLRRAGIRYRWVSPTARLFMRCDRSEGELWPREPCGRHAALLLHGHNRAARPNRTRLRAHAAGTRRRRSARPYDASTACSRLCRPP
jgi:hypothetical protein